jgi:8-oxo-dGTP diphosphatase
VNGVQIIVNCCVRWQGGIVMIRKPRRGWWYLPGGKVDPGEIWIEAAAREVKEETGLTVEDLRLRGIHLVQVEAGNGEPAREQAIIQFSANRVTGQLLAASKEGEIRVVEVHHLHSLPMNEGDRQMIERTVWADEQAVDTVFYGQFKYTADHRLLDWRVLPEVGSATRVEQGS